MALLQVNLDAPLPAELEVGLGTALFVHGTCFDPEGEVRGLAFRVGDGPPQPVTAFGMPRFDHFRTLHPRLDPDAFPELDPDSPEDPHLHSYRSGFWGLARIGPAPPGSTLELKLEASIDGARIQTVVIGRIGVTAPPTPLAPDFPGPAGQPRVAICMATYNPPSELLRRQLDSIRAQTHTNWVCVISDDASRSERFAAIEELVGDDPRFAVSRSSRRLGFYANFERALALAPQDCEYVALADQDDAWYPDKLAVLLDAIGDAQLAYSDMRIVGRGGEEIAGGYWERRRNNHSDLTSLLVANSVTGAASLFRRRLLDRALPFPPDQFAHYHDHWLALNALVTGGIEYVDRPLYDYVQHGTATIGHAASTRVFTLRERARKLRANRGKREPYYRATYFRHVERLMAFAAILLMRCGDCLSPAHRRALKRFLALESSWPQLARLAWLAAEELTGEPETLGAEWMLLRALVWRRVLAVRSRGAVAGRIGLDALPPRDLAPPGERRAIGDEGSRALAKKVEPLDLAVSSDAPRRVNLLIPTIDLEHLFGGYIAKFNLARCLARRGVRVRVVTVEPVDEQPRDWISRVESYGGLEGLFDRVELAFGRRAGSLEVSPHDSFIATTWWTAHIAARAAEDLGRQGFLYLIQEFEPLTFPMGSHAALADQSYRFEHFALFSSEILRDYFRAHRIGVYAGGTAAGDARSASFQNAISAIDPPAAGELRSRRIRRLLFYARPEAHAARNMFELGILALGRALEEGAFRSGWELRGIGTVDRPRPIDLGGDVELELLPRVDQREYAARLREHDLGLALMYTPHPSLVPIEMARAGLLTVTNTFENKTAEALAAISSNLIAVPAAIDALAEALAGAAAAVEDVDRRVGGTAVDWSLDWNQSFDDRLVDLVASYLSPM
ncbi:MAG TPA: glycosyltransferase family 2 protein [Solirubrobacteraceae bacterium]|nr:glycosyltransferase family 2 protein [Solirubrobacteraceae bacterium]